MAATDARPVPRKNAAFRFYFAIRKNDGTLITTWAGADSEVSIDGAAFSDCTNEATEIGSSGVGYIDLTSSEMNGDAVVLKTTVTNTSALPLVVTFFPEEAGDYRADVTHFGGTAGTFSGGRPEVNTTHAAGTAWGSGAITAAAIAADAITAAKVAADVTTEIQSGLATAAALATVDTVVDSILAAIGTPVGASISDDIAALPTAAEINAEVVDALTVDTYAEPSAVPAATASIVDKISWTTALARNRITETSSTQTLRNDANSGSIATAAVSDDGTTLVRDKWA